VHILDFFAPFLVYFHDIFFLFGKNVVILHRNSQVSLLSISKNEERRKFVNCK